MQRMTARRCSRSASSSRVLQRAYPKMRLLHGTELNIDPEGEVDWDEAFLEGFDVTGGERALPVHAIARRHDAATPARDREPAAST